jgi:hypothetical protein
VSCCFIALTAPVGACRAGGGPFGLDHEWTYDNSGIWKRSNQNALLYGLIGGELVGAVWEGGCFTTVAIPCEILLSTTDRAAGLKLSTLKQNAYTKYL